MLRSIMCVLPAVPSPNTGGGTLLYEVLAYLRSRGSVHAVVPVATHLHEEYEALQRDSVLHGVEWHALARPTSRGALARLATVLSPLPGDVHKFATSENQRLVRELRARCRPDVELLIASKAAAAFERARLPDGVRVYMMDVDPAIVRYDGPSLKRRLATVIERPKVDRLCRRVLAAAARVGSISPLDVPILNRLGRRGDVTYVPPLMRPRFLERAVESGRVLITTNFTYPPNVQSLTWFFRECWPHVDPSAQLTVTGKDEGGLLAALCTRSPRVNYTGCVSAAELDAIYARSAVAVNPTLSGSGFQIKLLDAIARGVPIVSTTFSNRLGDAIPSSDDPQELAGLINCRLKPDAAESFDYRRFYADATNAWDEFLFGSLAG
jgi:glycosyltransferase involved in cell wall biosynthesis